MNPANFCRKMEFQMSRLLPNVASYNENIYLKVSFIHKIVYMYILVFLAGAKHL